VGAFAEGRRPRRTCSRSARLDAAQAASFEITYQTGCSRWSTAPRCARRDPARPRRRRRVGIAAIQLGRASRQVIATAGSDEKLEICQAGAHHALVLPRRRLIGEVMRQTGGRGADVIYDPVGGEVFDRASCIAGGRIR
jgi:NADPH2:quinone reductase